MIDTIENNFDYINITQFQSPTYVSEVITQPTTDDYTKGVFIRYFAKQKNINTNNVNSIIEIDGTQFSSLTSSEYYDVFSITWMITGTYDNILETNVNTTNQTDLLYPGFREKMRPYILNGEYLKITK